MNLINQSFEIYEQNTGLEGIYEAIETAGRTCYKSTRPEGKTAKNFVDMLVSRKHLAMLEHATIYLKIPKEQHIAVNHDIFNNPYTKWKVVDGNVYISTNYRVLYENDWMYLLKYLCEPTEFHEKRITVHFVTSIGIVRELLRHRRFSFANESTRYCNYSKGKFNHELTFIIPSWCRTKTAIEIAGPRMGFAMSIEKTPLKEEEKIFYAQLKNSEDSYMFLLKEGLTPQQAREVLPLATKSELVMTGFVSDWEHLFRLRTSFIAETGKPHPDMVNLCDPLYKEFIDREYIKA